MKIKSMMTIMLDDKERDRVIETKDMLNKLSEAIVKDPEGRAVFSANHLKTAADILDNILEGKELY